MAITIKFDISSDFTGNTKLVWQHIMMFRIFTDIKLSQFNPVLNTYSLNAGELDSFGIEISDAGDYAFNFTEQHEIMHVQMFTSTVFGSQFPNEQYVYSSNINENGKLQSL